MTAARYGLTTPAEIAGRTGRQILQAIVEGELPGPPMAATLSFWLVEIGDGRVVFAGEPGRHLLNPMGVVHGGWALALIDSACGCAAQSVLPAGVAYTTIETKANFARPITEDAGRVTAEGRVVARGRQIISAEAKVLRRDGKLLAHGTSTLLVLAPAG
jgi:uncharacterized protein (TIGR00369 family)